MSLAAIYLESIRKRFEYWKDICDRALVQLDEEDFHFRQHDQCNSIAMIMRHTSGNMRSRFIGFLTEDGEKAWRNRDAEFEHIATTKAALLKDWEESWECLFAALDEVNENNLSSTITIRHEPHSVIDALNRQLGHYAYHAGQIIQLAKLIKGKDWHQLSVPKGSSEAFNEQMRKQHT